MFVKENPDRKKQKNKKKGVIPADGLRTYTDLSQTYKIPHGLLNKQAMDTRNHCHIPTSITELFQVSHNVALKTAEGIFNVTSQQTAM